MCYNEIILNKESFNMDEGSRSGRYQSTWKLDDSIVQGLVSRQRERQHEMLAEYEKELLKKKNNQLKKTC